MGTQEIRAASVPLRRGSFDLGLLAADSAAPTSAKCGAAYHAEPRRFCGSGHLDRHRALAMIKAVNGMIFLEPSFITAQMLCCSLRLDGRI